MERAVRPHLPYVASFVSCQFLGTEIIAVLKNVR